MDFELIFCFNNFRKTTPKWRKKERECFFSKYGDNVKNDYQMKAPIENFEDFNKWMEYFGDFDFWFSISEKFWRICLRCSKKVLE